MYYTSLSGNTTPKHCHTRYWMGNLHQYAVVGRPTYGVTPVWWEIPTEFFAVYGRFKYPRQEKSKRFIAPTSTEQIKSDLQGVHSEESIYCC